MAAARVGRTGLATRVAILGAVVAVITGVLAGLLAAGLIGDVATAGARTQLSRLADAAAQGSDTPRGQRRLELTLRAVNVRIGWAGPAGGVDTADPLVAAALTGSQLDAARGGAVLSLTEKVRGIELLVQARPTPDGGAVVLAQRSIDAAAFGTQAVRRAIISILVGVAIAAAAGSLLARQVARPLRRASHAARQLAAGRRDVTVPPQGPREVAAIADSVTALAAALTRSEARQRDFLMSISHELRTPLTAITGYAESLTDGVIPPADRPAAAGVILTEANRLTRLVGDLLDLARLDADEFRITVSRVDLTAVAEAAASVYAGRCAAADVTFSARLLAAPVWLTTDPMRLRQLLDALFDNALRVTPAGQPIVLEERLGPDAAIIELRDGGPGLTDDDITVAFDRAELHRRYQGIRPVGSGLGLAIVASLATRLGGTISAGHADEGGARFTLRLPRNDQSAADSWN